MTRLTQPLERMLDALTDPARRERAVVWLLTAYCAAWSLYGALAKGSQDVHFDMGEMVAWSRDAGIGTVKHPPLGAWLVGAWFKIFPQADWAYYVFAMVLATFALWVAWRVSEGYLEGEKRVAGLLLLTFIPFFSFHALKYNANTVLIPLWALVTWFFLRSYETRSVFWAALAGAAAAAAMMGKYWSVFLLAGLGIAALADPRRAQYFGSAAPWVTIAVGAILFAPHVAWLVATGFRAVHLCGGGASIDVGERGAVGTRIPARRRRLYRAGGRALGADDAPERGRDRRYAVAARAGAPLRADRLPGAARPADARRDAVQGRDRVALGDVRHDPAAGRAAVLAARHRDAPRRRLAARRRNRLSGSDGARSALHRGLDPSRGRAELRHALPSARAGDRPDLAANVKAPLRSIGSYTNIINGVSFYLPDKPSTLDIVDPPSTPWSDAASVARFGVALVCPEAEAICMHFLNQRAGDLPRHAVTLSRPHWGVRGQAGALRHRGGAAEIRTPARGRRFLLFSLAMKRAQYR